jgi:hypothetical protein
VTGPAGLRGTVSHGRGKRGAFPPPAPTNALSPLQWQGPSPLPQRHADPWPAGGPKPPASARPAPGGRWPAVRLDLPVYGALSRTGGETQCVSASRPKGQSPSPNREDFSGGRRSDCLYSILLKKRPLSVGRMARPVMARIALKRPEQNRCRSSQLTEVRRQPESRCAGLVERPGDHWRA